MTQFQYRIGPFRRYFSRVVFHRSVSTRLIQSFSGHTTLIVIKDIRFVRMEHTFDYLFCLQRTLKVKRFPLTAHGGNCRRYKYTFRVYVIIYRLNVSCLNRRQQTRYFFYNKQIIYVFI